MTHLSSIVTIFLSLAIIIGAGCTTPGINRERIVVRHQIKVHNLDSLGSLSLGNGRFAMTMDITGLQTFPEYYCKGIPLGTQTEWGWHHFPTTETYTIDETFKPLLFHNRQIPYAVQWNDTTRAGKAANYIRQNPHRIHLGQIGLYIVKSDGSEMEIGDIKSIDQTLDIWNGELTSVFYIEGKRVKVVSVVGQETEDVVGFSIQSDLINEKRLGIHIRYPYPTGQFLDEACLYHPEETASLNCIPITTNRITIRRTIDDTRYFTNCTSSLPLQKATTTAQGFIIMPQLRKKHWNVLVSFSQKDSVVKADRMTAVRASVHRAFHQYWNSGAIIDFGKVKDHRAMEIERRMILSLYLTRINCGGNSPPQETGLTYNSWFGRPHLEMAWWHGVHFALWGHPEILEQQMTWYLRNYATAKKIAERQQFKGVRWQKMTDNNGGETVSSIGSYLIWQQPHFIYFAELLYQTCRKPGMLHDYAPLVEATADFMADFVWFDTASNRYVLGPGIIPAQERFDPEKVTNPAFELAYWRWGLETAQLWQERTVSHRNVEWDAVLDKLSALPVKDSLYLPVETIPDSYSHPEYLTDHPVVLAMYGMLPSPYGLDWSIMHKTFTTVWNTWNWDKTWGWDFPLCAMTATRLGMPDKAIDALLMPVTTNTFLANGHNYQNSTLRIYLPGNGAFLTALAMMVNGTRQNSTKKQGFPADWDIAFEGFDAMF